MEKLKQLISTVASISIELKKNNKPVNPILSYLVLILGTYQFLKLMGKSYQEVIYPTLRKLFYFIFKSSTRLITKDPFILNSLNPNKWVFIYGANNHVGQQAAKLMAKLNYSLILVDSNLDKLKNLAEDIGKIFPNMTNSQGYTYERIKLLNINFAIWRDSTALEHKIREVVDINSCMPIFINCISFINEWQVCEDKLFHEVQFDQIYQYTGNTIIGFSIFFNFFTRMIVHHKQQSCVINLIDIQIFNLEFPQVLTNFQNSFKIIKKEVKPFDRTSYAMAILRVLYFPLYYHKLLERMNLMHYGVNKYISEVSDNAALGYPMLRTFNLIIDSRESRTIEQSQIENMMQSIRY